jgi:hypothetical protein
VQIAGRRGRSFAGIAAGPAAAPAVLALGGLCAAFVLTPTDVSAAPAVCPFRLATGLPCPGCGLTRSWTALAHGEFRTAFRANLFGPLAFVASVAFLALTITSPLTGLLPARLAHDRRLRMIGKLVVSAWVCWAMLRATSVALGSRE